MKRFNLYQIIKLSSLALYLMVGCTSMRTYKSTKYDEDTQMISKREVSNHIHLDLLTSPSSDATNLPLRLLVKEIVEYEITEKTTKTPVITTRRPVVPFEALSDGNTQGLDPIPGLVYVVAKEYDNTVRFLLGSPETEKTEERLSSETEHSIKKYTKTEDRIAKNTGFLVNGRRINTNSRGILTYHHTKGDLERKTVIVHIDTGRRYTFAIAEYCEERKRGWLRVSKAIYDVFGLYKTVNDGIAFKTGRISIQGFVVGLLMDAATDVVVDYAFKSLLVKCVSCRYEWELEFISDGQSVFCPKCKSHDRFKVELN